MFKSIFTVASWKVIGRPRREWIKEKKVVDSVFLVILVEGWR
jgi:hypothetical protein